MAAPTRQYTASIQQVCIAAGHQAARVLRANRRGLPSRRPRSLQRGTLKRDAARTQWTSAARLSLTRMTAAIGTVLHLVPDTLPLLAPTKRSSAVQAGFSGRCCFLCMLCQRELGGPHPGVRCRECHVRSRVAPLSPSGLWAMGPGDNVPPQSSRGRIMFSDRECRSVTQLPRRVLVQGRPAERSASVSTPTKSVDETSCLALAA